MNGESHYHRHLRSQSLKHVSYRIVSYRSTPFIPVKCSVPYQSMLARVDNRFHHSTVHLRMLLRLQENLCNTPTTMLMNICRCTFTN